jgi:hypothetical protein
VTTQRLVSARSNFNLETVTKSGKCRGCKTKIEAGEKVYVSRFTNPHNKRQNCVAYLCNLESCWEDYDEQLFPQMAEHFDGERTNV